MNTELKKALGIFLIGLFTFGIGNIVLIYILSNKALTDADGKLIYPMKETVLNLITVGIYGFFWAYKMGQKLDVAEGLEYVSSQTIIGTILALPLLRSFCMAYIYYRMEIDKDITEV